jgi:hypothetical protein
MRKVELRMNEQMKYEIIRRVAFKERPALSTVTGTENRPLP